MDLLLCSYLQFRFWYCLTSKVNYYCNYCNSRTIIALVEGKITPYDPLSVEIALPPLLFIIGGTFVYWLILILIELKAFRAIKRIFTKQK